MITDRQYCTLSAVQKETGNSDAALEVWFNECIDTASRWIDDHCHIDFGIHEFDSESPLIAHPDDVCGKQLFVPWPIISINTVTIDDRNLPMDYLVFFKGQRSISWHRNRELWDSQTLIAITGVLGYEDIPPGIRLACTRIASAFSQEKRRERVDMSGQRTSLLDDRIPDDSITILKRYRRLVH